MTGWGRQVRRREAHGLAASDAAALRRARVHLCGGPCQSVLVGEVGERATQLRRPLSHGPRLVFGLCGVEGVPRGGVEMHPRSTAPSAPVRARPGKCAGRGDACLPLGKLLASRRVSSAKKRRTRSSGVALKQRNVQPRFFCCLRALAWPAAQGGAPRRRRRCQTRQPLPECMIFLHMPAEERPIEPIRLAKCARNLA